MTVIPVHGSKVAIEILLFGTLGIAELRRASGSPVFFLDELEGDDHEWADEYAERVTWPGNDTPTVCLLDTGVNRGHPLLEPAIAEDEIDAIETDWGRMIITVMERGLQVWRCTVTLSHHWPMRTQENFVIAQNR